MSNNQQDKIDLKQAFKAYAKREMEFYKSAERGKVYHRIIPNMQDNTKGKVDYFYNGIIVGGYIDTKSNTIVLNKLKVTKFGKEEEVPTAISVIESKIKETEMVCDNQLK